MLKSRQDFLKALSAATAVPLFAPKTKPADLDHCYIAGPQSDLETFWTLGYPDETFAFTSFVHSVAAIAWGGGWFLQPTFVERQDAIVIDFTSRSEGEAEEAICAQWDRSPQFPLGTMASVQQLKEINEQNTQITRHICLIGTGVKSTRFLRKLAEPLRERLWPYPRHCIGAERARPRLAGVLQMVPLDMGHDRVQLFSQWKPSENLVESLGEVGVRLLHHELSSIPQADLDANRRYHIWHGTGMQSSEFSETYWAPAWKKHRVRNAT